jgi:hypothetical protein
VDLSTAKVSTLPCGLDPKYTMPLAAPAPTLEEGCVADPGEEEKEDEPAEVAPLPKLADQRSQGAQPINTGDGVPNTAGSHDNVTDKTAAAFDVAASAKTPPTVPTGSCRVSMVMFAAEPDAVVTSWCNLNRVLYVPFHLDDIEREGVLVTGLCDPRYAEKRWEAYRDHLVGRRTWPVSERANEYLHSDTFKGAACGKLLLWVTTERWWGGGVVLNKRSSCDGTTIHPI